jgi:hypothetical protein
MAWDTETHKFSVGLLCPPLSCIAVGSPTGPVYIATQHNKRRLRDFAELVVTGSSLAQHTPGHYGAKIVGHHTAFDLAVIGNAYPDLLPFIFQGLEDGLYEDTMIRDQFLHLSSHGDLEFYSPEEGCAQVKLSWSLEALSNRWLRKSRKELKEGDDQWRTNYCMLENLPAEQWPEEARQYVMDDVIDCHAIRELQEDQRFQMIHDLEIDPFKTQDFRVAVSFALYLMSSWGFRVDAERLQKIETDLAKELTAEHMQHMVSAGVLKPATPPVVTYSKKGIPRTRAAKKESINKRVLEAYVTAFAERNGIELEYTPLSGKAQMTMDFFEAHKDKDPLLGEYFHRQKLQKLVTTELPRLKWEGQPSIVVHPGYDYLKSTGRISSRASKMYPSLNVQNVDPRARGCFIPREGFLLFSIDYTGMELGTTAQVCYSLFGHSVMRDKINANIDLHAYLGSQLAYHLSDVFRGECQEKGWEEPDAIYEAFGALSKSDKKEDKDFFKHWRKFAKPTGLGFPGGLGPKTFVDYARATYGVEVDLETAKQLREIWRGTYPEMVEYFEYINTQCGDKYQEDKYAYMSPMGMYRAGCDYCAVANGMALQTPSAEGALLSVFNIVRACYDPSMNSFIGGGSIRPIAFVHDEVVGEVYDDQYAPERVNEVARIMVESMRAITPDVTPRAQACLMRRWDKSAEPVYDLNGRLIVWEPKAK